MGKKILMVFGTRPEAIKMAPVYYALNETTDFDVEICSTGQHREMLDQVMQLFDLPTHYRLDVMTREQNLFSLTSTLISRLEETITDAKPDCILLHGDTTSSMVAAMAGFYSQIPIGHIEAGLRTRRLDSPFPEEFNRRVNSIVTDWHFAPTDINRQNLIDEQVKPAQIYVTGNTVVDALQMMVRKIDNETDLQTRIRKELQSQIGFDPVDWRYILVTCHRRENFGDGLEQICDALLHLAATYKDMNFVFPVHLNPNVNKIVSAKLGSIENIHLLKPVSYEVFCYLLNAALLILTDSGGVQEEAPSLGKPVLVMRDTTERPEAVTAGTVKLVGTETKTIIDAVDGLLKNPSLYEKMAHAHNPYGDGKSASRITSILQEVLV